MRIRVLPTSGEIGRRGAKIGEFATVPPQDPAASSSSDMDDVDEEEKALGIDAIRAKAAVIRISIALQPFSYALRRLERAVRWRDYASSASLHLALLFFASFQTTSSRSCVSVLSCTVRRTMKKRLLVFWSRKIEKQRAFTIRFGFGVYEFPTWLKV